MAATLKDGKLRLSGYVGDYYYDDGFTSSDVVLALAEIDADAELDCHINSPGGIASEGAAIHALLVARLGTTNIIVEGIAASAASLIAMAGETVTMSAGAVMMIHDPAGMTWGTSADHSKTIEGLEALATAYARVYADKSGKTTEQCREIMKAERWYTPEEAVAEGFADATTEAKAQAVAAFDYRMFAHAPQRLKIMARKKNWSAETDEPAAPPAKTSQPQDKTMTDKERADLLAAENETLKATSAKAGGDAIAADRERRKTILALDEAKGREELAEHLYASTTMSADEIKATLAVSPKSSEGDVPEPQPVLSYEDRRTAAAGLTQPGGNKGKPTMKVDLVADMQRRHGIV